jgi:hypothetical protein
MRIRVGVIGVLAVASLVPATASAGELELAGYAGPVFPFYEQAFEFDPGSLSGLPPNVSVEQQDIFRLDAKGGLALGAGVAWQFAPWFGLEARVDTADVSARITGARYLIRLDLPDPLPDLTNELTIGGGDASLHRLYPVSFNFRARTPGRTNIGASAGLSYLPSFSFEIVQRATLQPPAPLPPAEATVTLAAEALPATEDQGRFGANAGVFVQVGIGERAALVAEGRYFHFSRQTLVWSSPRVEPELPLIGQTVVEEIAGQLDPVDFNPTFFQLTAGLALRF